MKYKIGVFGSAVDEGADTAAKAARLGEELAKFPVLLITGAGHGIPYIVAMNASKHGSEVWGFPPVTNTKAQKEYAQEDDISLYTKTFYVPKELPFAQTVDASRQYRNLLSTFTCDGAIIISGRWGTLNEFTNLMGMEKVIGVLIGTKGIADELENLTKKISKPSKAKVIFHTSPKELIKEMITELDKRSKHKVK